MIARVLIVFAALATILVACGSDGAGPSSEAPTPAADAAAEATPATTPVATDTPPPTAQPVGDGLFPDVLAVDAREAGGLWTFDVTLSSPYDSPERYADAWRVLAPDGTELGIRELLHDHAGEQPFTRSLSGVEIPPDVTEVTVEGRDQVNGWGGATVTVVVAG